jgi:hypothetical protein
VKDLLRKLWAERSEESFSQDVFEFREATVGNQAAEPRGTVICLVMS